MLWTDSIWALCQRRWGQILTLVFRARHGGKPRARPLRILCPNAFYHVTCRGNDRRVIFRDDHDRARFLDRLRSAREIFSVRVHAYVLMSNHFHLIVETLKTNRAMPTVVVAGRD
jgi:Transposase IS200 like